MNLAKLKEDDCMVIQVVTCNVGKLHEAIQAQCQRNILLNYHPDDILSTLNCVATWFPFSSPIGTRRFDWNIQ
jgi:hypothetical protein